MWERIKKILQKEGGKCIIVEENQPTYVVMRMEDYERAGSSQSSSEIEKANQDIDEWKAKEKEETEVVEPDNQEIKVEDLPF
jgi:hypothetical protein